MMYVRPSLNVRVWRERQIFPVVIDRRRIRKLEYHGVWDGRDVLFGFRSESIF
jgi:hypothetical protein